jgi:hypothetical protein
LVGLGVMVLVRRLIELPINSGIEQKNSFP